MVTDAADRRVALWAAIERFGSCSRTIGFILLPSQVTRALIGDNPALRLARSLLAGDSARLTVAA
jgi:hypothetical protein